MRHLLRFLAAATVLLAPLVLGSGCVTFISQLALGNVGMGCPGPPPLVAPADRAWLVAGGDGPDCVLLERRDEGEAPCIVCYPLDRFEKEGSIEPSAELEVDGAGYEPPKGARPLARLEDVAQAREDGIDAWGGVQVGAARYRLRPRWRPEPWTAAKVIGIAITPITVALDVGLIPVYATVALGAGAGYGVYRGGKAIGDALD